MNEQEKARKLIVLQAFKCYKTAELRVNNFLFYRRGVADLYKQTSSDIADLRQLFFQSVYCGLIYAQLQSVFCFRFVSFGIVDLCINICFVVFVFSSKGNCELRIV